MSKKYQTMKKAIKMEIKEHRKSFLEIGRAHV